MLLLPTGLGKCQFNFLVRLTLTQVGSDVVRSFYEFARLVAGTFQAMSCQCVRVRVSARACVYVCDCVYLRLFMHVNVSGASHEGKNTIMEALASSSRAFCVYLDLVLATSML